MGQQVQGTCRLCGDPSKLTKEHIPAAGAFKGMPYRVDVLRGDVILNGGRPIRFQRGYHSRVFCDDCNRRTGSWYGDEFARWSRWGLSILDGLRQPSPPAPTIFTGHPLRIVKQILSTMVASSPGLVDRRPDIAEFVLSREQTRPLGWIRLKTFLCPTRTGRITGIAVAVKAGGQPHILVEFALRPFGYVLTLAGEPLDPRPVDISWFTACHYDERCPVAFAELPILPTHEVYPGDYRTRAEIARDVIDALKSAGHPTPEAEAARLFAIGYGPDVYQRIPAPW